MTATSGARRWRRRRGWRRGSTTAGSSTARIPTRRVRRTRRTTWARRSSPPAEPGAPPGMLLFVAPRDAWTMLDDWGDTLGLKGSGSHSVRFEHARIPAHFALENTWMVDTDVSHGTPGYRLHGNPMYAGRTLSFFQSRAHGGDGRRGEGCARGVRGRCCGRGRRSGRRSSSATSIPTTSAGSAAPWGSSPPPRRC